MNKMTNSKTTRFSGFQSTHSLINSFYVYVKNNWDLALYVLIIGVIWGLIGVSAVRGQGFNPESVTAWLAPDTTSYCSEFGRDYQYSRDYLLTVNEIMALKSYELRIDFDSSEVTKASFGVLNSFFDANLSRADFLSREYLIAEVIGDDPQVLIPGVVYKMGCLIFNVTNSRPLTSKVVTRYFKWNTNHIAGSLIPDIDLNTLTGDFTEEDIVDPISKDSTNYTDSTYIPIKVPENLELEVTASSDSLVTFRFFPLQNKIIKFISVEGKLEILIKDI